jgi:hypothetical protein
MRRVALNRRLSHSLVRFCVAALLTLVALPALSAPRDAAAIKMAEDAINVDYLATNFAEAEKKLRRAIALCGTTACSAQVRARIHRDLGVVLVAGLNRPDDGKAEFTEALKADPTITLDKDLTTPDVDQAFRAAGGTAGAPAPAAPAAPGAAPTAPAAPAAAGGDMIHTPPPEQTVLTPVPIYAELPAGAQATKVVVRYRPFGSQEWKTLEMRRLGNGFGAEIPCLDIGSETGDLSYYIQAFGGAGDVVSSSGSRAAPNKVAIRNQLAGEPPHLPGRPPSAQCADVANCPPGLPGCPSGKKGGGKGWGASCERDSECGPGLACKAGSCEAGEKSSTEGPEAGSCDTDADCNSGEKCNEEKVCEGPGGKGKKVWLTLAVEQDISILGGIKDVCGSTENEPAAQVLCLAQDGLEYRAGRPEKGNGNAIAGGLHVATTRFLAGIDLFVAANVSIGARAGYAINVAPDKPTTSAIHGEARVAYWFGKDPTTRRSVRPYVALLGGVAEVDDKFKTQISETLATDPTQGIIFPTQDLTVWRHSGGGFVGAGLGTLIPVSPSSGFLVELKLNVMLPNSGFALAPAVGYSFGL